MHPIAAHWASRRANSQDEAEQIFQVALLVNTAAELDALRAATNNNHAVLLALLQQIGGAPVVVADVDRLRQLLVALGPADASQLVTLLPAAGGIANWNPLLAVFQAQPPGVGATLNALVPLAGGAPVLADVAAVLNMANGTPLRALALAAQANGDDARFHVYRLAIPLFQQNAAPGVGGHPGISNITAYLQAAVDPAGGGPLYRLTTNNLQYILQRHTYLYFDFSRTDALNSMFTGPTTAAQVATFIQQALNTWHAGNAGTAPAGWPNPMTHGPIVNGAPINTQIADGTPVEVGTYGGAIPRNIAHFFPLYNAAHNDPVNQTLRFSRAEMLAIEPIA